MVLILYLLSSHKTIFFPLTFDFMNIMDRYSRTVCYSIFLLQKGVRPRGKVTVYDKVNL